MQPRFLVIPLFTLAMLAAADTAGAAATGSSAASAAATTAAPAHAASAWKKKKKPALAIRPIDINSASRTELKKLPGVDDALAARIIANRPYLTKAELVTKQVMPKGPFLALKDRVVAVNKNPIKKASS